MLTKIYFIIKFNTVEETKWRKTRGFAQTFWTWRNFSSLGKAFPSHVPKV